MCKGDCNLSRGVQGVCMRLEFGRWSLVPLITLLNPTCATCVPLGRLYSPPCKLSAYSYMPLLCPQCALKHSCYALYTPLVYHLYPSVPFHTICLPFHTPMTQFDSLRLAITTNQRAAMHKHNLYRFQE